MSNEGSRNGPWASPAPGNSQEWQQQHVGQSYGQQPQPRLKLTPEEVAVLQACSRESFFYRCVPLAIGAIAVTQTLTNRGILKPHPRFGALFKNMGAALVAYFFGKVSYQGECRRKIMMLENSPLADAMRKGKKGRELFQDMTIMPPIGGGQMPAPNAPDFNPQNRPAGSHLDMDTDSRRFKELDDGLRPTLDSAERKPRDDSRSQSHTNYADLRAQNRMDYERKMSHTHEPSGQARPPVSQYGDRPPLPPPPASSDMYSGMGSSASEPPGATRRNKYGDVIE